MWRQIIETSICSVKLLQAVWVFHMKLWKDCYIASQTLLYMYLKVVFCCCMSTLHGTWMRQTLKICSKFTLERKDEFKSWVIFDQIFLEIGRISLLSANVDVNQWIHSCSKKPYVCTLRLLRSWGYAHPFLFFSYGFRIFD